MSIISPLTLSEFFRQCSVRLPLPNARRAKFAALSDFKMFYTGDRIGAIDFFPGLEIAATSNFVA